MKPPCLNTRIRAFIDPDNAPPFSVRAAKKICEHCPIIRICAVAGMSAGETIDGVKFPARGVIVAGIHMDGRHENVECLAAVAGVEPPEKVDSSATAFKRRNVKGVPCKACGKPLWPWTSIREDVPAGYVIHRGRGYCTQCRQAYNAELAAWKAANPEAVTTRKYSRKPIDRKRHHGGRAAEGRKASEYRRAIAAASTSAEREHLQAEFDAWLDSRAPRKTCLYPGNA